jgi:hypothetical protein
MNTAVMGAQGDHAIQVLSLLHPLLHHLALPPPGPLLLALPPVALAMGFRILVSLLELHNSITSKRQYVSSAQLTIPFYSFNNRIIEVYLLVFPRTI